MAIGMSILGIAASGIANAAENYGEKNVPWKTVGTWKVKVQLDGAGNFRACAADLAQQDARLRVASSTLGKVWLGVIDDVQGRIQTKGTQPVRYQIDAKPAWLGNGYIALQGAALSVAVGPQDRIDLSSGKKISWEEQNRNYTFNLGNFRGALTEMETCLKARGEGGN